MAKIRVNVTNFKGQFMVQPKQKVDLKNIWDTILAFTVKFELG